MEDTKVLKCRNCGAELDLRNANGGIIECEYCHSVFTLPKDETTPEALAFLRMGEHDLDTCNWDGAVAAYKKAWEKSKNEPEVFWGLALASYKVQYIKDVVNNRLQPICHEISTRKFTESGNYQTALKLATPAQRKEYEKKAAEIEYIKDEFYRLKQSGLNFDCFICVKVTDENGEKTEDYKDAESIYDLLKERQYKPFFSERSIRNRTGADYEAMILYALYSAETMLVVCRNEDYLQTPWVKNEYTRFLRLVNDEEKESDSITIVYHGTPIEKLAGKRGKIQGIDFSRRDAGNRIINFVDSHTPKAKARREELKRKKQEEEAEIRRQIEEQKQSQKELEEKLKNLKNNSGSGAVVTNESLMKRAYQEMGYSDYSKAEGYFNKILDIDPENAEAWWGLFLCEFGTADEQNLLTFLNANSIKKITESKYYLNAIKYATLKFKDRVEDFRSKIKDYLNKEIERKEDKIKQNTASKEQAEKKYKDTLRHKRELVEGAGIALGLTKEEIAQQQEKVGRYHHIVPNINFWDRIGIIFWNILLLTVVLGIGWCVVLILNQVHNGDYFVKIIEFFGRTFGEESWLTYAVIKVLSWSYRWGTISVVLQCGTNGLFLAIVLILAFLIVFGLVLLIVILIRLIIFKPMNKKYYKQKAIYDDLYAEQGRQEVALINLRKDKELYEDKQKKLLSEMDAELSDLLKQKQTLNGLLRKI